MQLTLLSPDAGIKHVTVTPGRYHSEKCWALIEPYNSSSPPLSTAIDAEAYGSYKAQHSTEKYNSEESGGSSDAGREMTVSVPVELFLS